MNIFLNIQTGFRTPEYIFFEKGQVVLQSIVHQRFLVFPSLDNFFTHNLIYIGRLQGKPIRNVLIHPQERSEKSLYYTWRISEIFCPIAPD